jgi:hypothetical protein
LVRSESHACCGNSGFLACRMPVVDDVNRADTRPRLRLPSDTCAALAHSAPRRPDDISTASISYLS